MKKIAFIIFTAIAIIYFSCGDVWVRYAMYIDNQSSDTIKIVFHDESPYTIIRPDYLFFPPLQKKLLWGTSEHPIKDGCDYTGINEDEVTIYSTSEREIKKAIWEVSNWDCQGSFKDGWILTFVIEEEDLKILDRNKSQ